MASRDIDLNSQEWRDLVFEGKNKSYGSYYLRKTSTKRHIRSMLIVTVFAIGVFLIPKLIKSVLPEKTVEEEIGPVVMTQLDPLDQKVKEENLIKQLEAVPPPPILKTTIKFTPPVIKKDEEVNEDDQMKTQDELKDSKAAISVADVKGASDGTGVDIADIPDNKVIVQAKEEIFSHVEQMPQYPGGDKEMMSYLAKNIKYPVIAQEQGIQGTVVLRFVVGKDGTVSDVIVQRSLDPSCDKEAIRVVKSMPRWVPGKQNGNPVLVYYTLPVRFKLANN